MSSIRIERDVFLSVSDLELPRQSRRRMRRISEESEVDETAPQSRILTADRLAESPNSRVRWWIRPCRERTRGASGDASQ